MIVAMRSMNLLESNDLSVGMFMMAHLRNQVAMLVDFTGSWGYPYLCWIFKQTSYLLTLAKTGPESVAVTLHRSDEVWSVSLLDTSFQ